ncbi:MAG TPA: response regulator [bacterium]|nr:response regulator [bacterium]
MSGKILIVDDEVDFCTVVKKTLEALAGYEVACCSDSTRAMATATAFRPDVILLDVLMPFKSGPELALDLRKEPALAAIPIIFITGIGFDSELGEKLRGAAVEHFVEKPVRMRQLHEVIQKILSGKKG